MQERILVVDDDNGMRETLEAVLSSDGYQLGVAAGGAEALQILKRDEFDIILLDLKMPGYDGLELLTQIRQHGLAGGNHHDDRLRNGQGGRGGGQTRRLRFYNQTF